MTGRLPNLLIAGVTKAGTTSLFTYLEQDPEICGSTLKEPEYFTRLLYPDTELAPLATYERYFRHCRNERYVMEASANYWYGGARLLAATERVLDRPRYIVSLRDPVERFWSDFTYMKSKVLLPADLTAVEFLERCNDLRAAGTEFTEAGRTYRTLSTGFYYDYLTEWLDAVGPRCRIVFFEHLLEDPVTTVGDTLEWLGLDRGRAAGFDYSERNQTISHRSPAFQRLAYGVSRRVDNVLRRYPRAKQAMVGMYHKVNRAGLRNESMASDLREHLDEIYRPHNRKLRDDLRARGYARMPAWLSSA